MMGKPDNYEDIIHLDRPISKKHPRLSMDQRAAQFSPFQALVGYGAVIEEEQRLTDAFRDADENELAALDEKLQNLLSMLREGQRPRVSLTVFEPDSKKDGGAYLKVEGTVLRLKTDTGVLHLLPEEEKIEDHYRVIDIRYITDIKFGE